MDGVSKCEVQLFKHGLHGAPCASPHVHNHCEAHLSHILTEIVQAAMITSKKPGAYNLTATPIYCACFHVADEL